MVVTTKDIGNALELRVAHALRSGGYASVQRNVILTDRHGNRSEIDVVFRDGLWRRSYIECKAYHGSGSNVGLEEVAKFKEVLSLNGIPLSRGLFITTTGFVPRALTTGVATLDGAGLAAWEARMKRRVRLRGLGKAAAGGALLLALGMALQPAAAAALGGGAAGSSGSGSSLLAQAQLGWAEGMGAGSSSSSSSGGWWGLQGSSSKARDLQGFRAEALARDAGHQAGAVVARARAWWSQR